MGLPTGAGREAVNVALTQVAALLLQWGCRPGPAERSLRGGAVRTARGFNGAADRGRQRATDLSLRRPGPSRVAASMGLPTGAGREHRRTRPAPRRLTLLQWGCRPGPAERGEPPTARALQWGCRPGPAEAQYVPGAPCCFNGAADRGRQRGPPTRRRPACCTRCRLQWGCRPGPAERPTARRGRRARRTSFNGAADRGRQRALATFAVHRGDVVASMGLPTGAGREADRERDLRSGASFNGAADRGRQRAAQGASMGTPSARARCRRGLQWGCRPGPAERGSTRCDPIVAVRWRFNGAADRGRQRVAQ